MAWINLNNVLQKSGALYRLVVGKAGFVNIYSKEDVDSIITTGSTSTATALANKVDKTTTVNGQPLSSNVSLTKADIGLGNVDNTSDTAKPISTATQTALNLKENLSNKNVANGYAGLNADVKIPTTLLYDSILGNLKYGGTTNGTTVLSSTDFPELIGNPLPTTGYKGVYFIATTTFTRAGTTYDTGDWLIHNGANVYSKVDNTDAVTTVFGRLGNVVATSGDYNASQITATNTGWKVLTGTNTQTALNSADTAILEARNTGVSHISGAITGVGLTQATLPEIKGGIVDVFLETYNAINYAGGTVTPINANGSSFFMINKAGAIVQSATLPTETDHRLFIQIGYCVATAGVIQSVATTVNPIQQTSNSLNQLSRILGQIKVSGLALSAPTANLNFSFSAGTFYLKGANMPIDENNPDTETANAYSSATTTFRNYTTAGIVNSANLLDVGFYQLAGVRTAIPNPNTNYSNFYVFRGRTGTIYVAYSRNFYTSASNALASLSQQEAFACMPSGFTRSILFLVGAITVSKNETNLQSATTYFTSTDLFGGFNGAVATASGNYLVASNNLADLTNVATARTNLGVYSTTQTDAAIATKANLSVSQIFTTDGTWTKPAGAKTVKVVCISGGGGGGSGRKGAAGTVRCGGGGGSAGSMVEYYYDANDLPSTVSVTIGTGGLGGASVTTNSTNGNNGTNGGYTRFGVYVRAINGLFGSGGTNSTGTGGDPRSGNISSVAGSSASTTGGVGVNSISPLYVSNSGASGGGITSGDVASAGGNGNILKIFDNATTPASNAGAINTSGGNGATPIINALGYAGGGGGSSTTGNAGNAGASTGWGAGGSGGGAATDGVGNSGAGGNGRDGACIVTTWF